jgi:hypothetical protein
VTIQQETLEFGQKFVRFVRRRLWRLGAFLEGFLIGGQTWGTIRILMVLAGTYALVDLGSYLFGGPEASRLNLWERPNLRFWVAPVGALLVALLTGINYLRDIYEIKDFGLAYRYLMAALFAWNYPTMTIADGRRKLGPDEINTLDLIGGPGYVHVNPGNVVLFERLQEPASVHGAGTYFISRLERIKEIASLEDQHGTVEALSATTKDGIEVVVRDVRFRYRICSDRKPGDYSQRTPSKPYPFSIQAVRRMTYNRSVSLSGLTSWSSAVSSAITGVISEYIGQRKYDQLTAQIDPAGIVQLDPREEIMKQFNSPRTRERLRNLGAELLWVDVGHFGLSEQMAELVTDQRLEAWEARWLGDAEKIRAEGDERRSLEQELGRAEAQADVLTEIVNALRQISPTGNVNQVVRNVVLARTAQMIDALGEQKALAAPAKDAGPERPERLVIKRLSKGE